MSYEQQCDTFAIDNLYLYDTGEGWITLGQPSASGMWEEQVSLTLSQVHQVLALLEPRYGPEVYPRSTLGPL